MKSAAKAMQAEEVAETGAHQIRDAIREAIVERRLSPGTKLSENDVGNLFNVSRTLARAALQALSYEGLVRVERTAAPLSPTPPLMRPARSFPPGVSSSPAYCVRRRRGSRRMTSGICESFCRKKAA